jgi:hypothetical protein
MADFKDEQPKTKPHGHYCKSCLAKWKCSTKRRADCPRPDATFCEECKSK